ncbi:hypothetical protein SGGMMB4_00997 [Sodalis glossinidius str. 'morsitans']|uniref:Uncharacterized protein n=1 Tax=Sodalis glossinidius (strain morsitans) TaxID=343509 RepID=A0A193QFZ7_SODGM|nr:hypothetical protein SGGMMB4_00997 [Sodalis glossinidius str. 'morsitans']
MQHLSLRNQVLSYIQVSVAGNKALITIGHVDVLRPEALEDAFCSSATVKDDSGLSTSSFNYVVNFR